MEISHSEWFTFIFPPAGKWIAHSKETKLPQNASVPTHTQTQQHTHYARMCKFFFLRDKNGTHQGRFITRHVSPVCCCTKIDSSPVELCFIKVNVFHKNAQPRIKCNTPKNWVWGKVYKNSWVAGRRRIYLRKFMTMYSQEWFCYSVTFGMLMSAYKDAQKQHQALTNSTIQVI